MWIREVDVASELIDAARTGRLVIFVGAGASRDEPSGLPDFRTLVEEIGARVADPPTNDEIGHPDVYLGRLSDKGIDVHQLVKNEIGRAGSEPNDLHKAIVKLVSVHPSPRIVTTNYDLHLTTAGLAEGLALPIYEGPALPIGDDFEGIVHLHGSLNQEPRRMVLTDNDFGRAYLLDAWAARFLERMFSAFTVAFIGYSHGDVVMQYMARSLGPSGKRFVFTSDGDNPVWRQYGLMPVAYPVVGETHAALPECLARWAELAAMGQTQHRAQIAGLVSAEPPTIPEEVSYLDEVLEHPERIRYFVERARGPDWFNWVAGRPAFQALFDHDRASADPTRTLISWLADHYMLDESTSQVALRAMREKPWPPQTWRTVVHRLLTHDGEMALWLSPWLLLALQYAPNPREDLLDLLLPESNWGENVGLAISLFEDRTRPVVKSTISFVDADAARFEIDLAGDEHWLSEAWSKVFLPWLTEHLAPLMASISEQIARVYRVLESLPDRADFDPISFGRSAIEPHEQDSFREPIDVLIDAARDCIEYALAHDNDLAHRYIDIWEARSEALFRRLAVHAWRIRPDRSPDEKLRWLEAAGWLWEVRLQHEVYLLLQDTLPTASDDMAQGLVDAAEAGPPADGDDEVRPYRSYNLLAWLARSAPERAQISEAFSDYQAAHPEFATREHPDLNSFMTSGFVKDALPYSADELHARIAEDPASAVEALRTFEADTLTFTGPTRTGVLRSVQSCVSTYPDDGLVVASILQHTDSELRLAIIQGWDTADLDENSIVNVLNVIDSWNPDEIRRATASMLSNGGTQANPTPWHQYPRARETARNLWPSQPAVGAISGDSLLTEAINHPAGDLAEFWTKAVQWEWTQAGDDWQGIPGELVAELDRMITAENHNGLLASAFLGSQLHFYFAADPTWATTRLLPLFDWNRNERTARGAWQGFLTWGRPNDGLLAAGLLNAYIETCRRQDALGSRLVHALSIHLASIAMHAATDPLEWLPRFVLAASEELRESWASQVGHSLKELDPEQTGAQWERWIRTYWSDRIQSTPLPLSSAEGSTMADWLIGLPTVRSEAVRLLVQTPAGLPQHSGFLYSVHNLDLASDAASWATAITHLLCSTAGPDWGVGHYLKGIVGQLRAADPALDLSELIEEAMRLGLANAAEW